MTTTVQPKGKSIKQIIKSMDLNYNDIQSDSIDIATAGVMTLFFTAFVLAFVYLNLPGWPTFNIFAFLYIAFNFTLLIKFTYQRMTNARTLDDVIAELDEIHTHIKNIDENLIP